VIEGKVLAIAPKWSVIQKVDPYRYPRECCTESFRSTKDFSVDERESIFL